MIQVRVSESDPLGDGTLLLDVTFVIPHRPEIASAAVVGDFNGWSATATPMHRSNGSMEANVRLAAGQRYRFKYLVNGDHWENDWAADGYETNADGGDDSVLDLERFEPQPGCSRARIRDAERSDPASPGDGRDWEPWTRATSCSTSSAASPRRSTPRWTGSTGTR